MHVYFNNNSSTQGEPLMDLFNKAAGSCSCGASKELSHTQAQPAAWVLLCPWLRDWDCTGLYQQDCVLLSIPNHVLCSTVSIMPEFAQVTNCKHGPGLFDTAGSAQVHAEMLVQPHIPSWDFKLTHSSWFPSTFDWLWTPHLFSLLNPKPLPAYSQK